METARHVKRLELAMTYKCVRYMYSSTSSCEPPIKELSMDDDSNFGCVMSRRSYVCDLEHAVSIAPLVGRIYSSWTGILHSSNACRDNNRLN